MEILRRKQAAAYLNISPSTMAKWAMTGGGPRFSKLGPRLTGYSRSDLDSWLESTRRQSTSEAGA